MPHLFTNNYSIRFILALLLLISWNILSRYPDFLAFDFLNDDSALLIGAASAFNAGDLLSFFYNSYGPSVIRPFIIISLAIQTKLWLTHPVFFYLSGFVILSISQAIFLIALSRTMPFSCALFAVLIAGSALLASEPTLWIADHHDIYLMFFCSLSLYLTVLAAQPNRASRELGLAACLFIIFWGGFYCNEKGTIVPVLSVIGFLLLNLTSSTFRANYESDLSHLLKRTLQFSISPLLAVVTYFAFRRYVLGVLVGGYDNAVLPPNGLNLEFITSWLKTLSQVPVYQATLEKTYKLQIIVVVFVCITMLLWLKDGIQQRDLPRRFAVAILLGGLLVLSSLPTFKYNAPLTFIGLQNSRFLWLPHLVSSILWGALFTTWSSVINKKDRKLYFIRYAPFLFLIPVIWGGRNGLKDFSDAHRLTSAAHSIYLEHCACSNIANPQTSGLPPIWRGVNVFTEKAWLDSFAQLKGTPACQPDDIQQSCNIEFHAAISGKLQYTPQRSSLAKLSQLGPLIRERSRPLSAVSFIEHDPLFASLSLWRNSQNPTSLRLRRGISAGGRAPLREEQL